MKGRSIIPRKLDFQVAVWLIALMHTCFPVMASGEGIRDFRDGWLLNPGDMAAILVPDEMPPSVGDEPLRASAPGGHWGLWAGVGQGALFSMVDLPLKFLEGGIVHRGHRWPWALAGSWERLGDMLIGDIVKPGRAGYMLVGAQTGVSLLSHSIVSCLHLIWGDCRRK